MALIPGICTQCGATLSLESNSDAMVCPYCNTPFIVEKAIQKYNITNNIKADTIIINNSEKDFEIVAGKLIKYKGEAKDVVIPDCVSSIGDSAFSRLKIRSVKIPSSVKEIQGLPFAGCNELEKVEFSKGLITIYGGLSGYGPFMNCTKLKELRFPDSLRKVTGNLGGDIETLYLSSKTIASEDFNGSIWCKDFNKISNIYVDEKLVDDEKTLLEVFPNTLVARQYSQKNSWEEQGLCKFCGGKFKGLFTKTCTVCGKKTSDQITYFDIKKIQLF